MSDQGPGFTRDARIAALEDVLRRRVVILDGATGTMIQERGLSGAKIRARRFADHPCDLQGNYDLVSLTHPEVIRDICGAYLEAGADIVKTNTFNATMLAQADYRMEHLVYELNLAGARLAREAADAATARSPGWPRFVAGVLGPTPRAASLPTDTANPAAREVTFDELVGAYREAMRGLVDGGVDLLLLETVFDTLNAKAAIFAREAYAEEHGVRLPLMISVTVGDPSGRTLSGQTLEAFCISVAHARPLSLGLNCGRGVEGLDADLEEVARSTEAYVSVHPNAGLPDETGRYRDTPARMATPMRRWAQRGLVNIVGGCCGTTPAHIRAIREAVADLSPRRLPRLPAVTRLSGLEPLALGVGPPLVIAGERANMAGCAAFQRAILDGDDAAIVALVRRQVDDGARMIDINVDHGLLDSERVMSHVVRLVTAEPAISRVPLMIDSAEWPVIEAGLRCVPGKSAVNSLSLREGEARFLAQARRARRYGAAIVVMASDEAGPGETRARKVEICRRAHALLTEVAGMPATDIIFDPVILPVGTGVAEHRRHGLDVIEAIREIKHTLAHVLVCGGVSNISFAFRGNRALRDAMHTVFLHHALVAGLDLGILRAGPRVAYEALPHDVRERLEDVILDRRPDATERLLEVAPAVRGEAPVAAARDRAWRRWPVRERLGHALVTGLDDDIEVDVEDARREAGTALAVIEGPLREGMQRVADLFAAGQIALPQVVKSARVMRKAVSCLGPHLEAERKAGGAGRGKIIMATVKGDVHDIGKNIVSTVLAGSLFDVVDLGVRVPAAHIVEAARREQADLVGLSGLITPSLQEMVEVAQAMRREGLTMPLLVGGAATSPTHTAVRIAPSYGGATVWVKDAARAVDVARRLTSPRLREALLAEVREEYERRRAEHARRVEARAWLSLAEARRRKPVMDWREYQPPAPDTRGPLVFDDYPLDEIRPYIDWTPFLHAWELRGLYARILVNGGQGGEGAALLADAQRMLDRVIAERWLTARAVVGLFPANSVGDDDVEVYEDEERGRVLVTFHFLRQQEVKVGGRPHECLADFVAPKKLGRRDYLGAFALTAGIGIEKHIARFEGARDDYSALMLRAIADRLAEALAERMHARVRTEFWAYARDECLDREALLREKYRGIRPAIGYPAYPDHTEKGRLWDLLEVRERIAMELTETFAMLPAASVSGLYFAHPQAHYFAVGRIDRDQVEDYARRKGMGVTAMERWLAPNLGYEPRPAVVPASAPVTSEPPASVAPHPKRGSS